MKKMKTILIISGVVIFLIAAAIAYRFFFAQPSNKIYVAVEGDGKIAVIHPTKHKVIKTIDLSVNHEGGRLGFAPHNVQVSPDNKTVWVTANATKHQDHTYELVPKVHAHGESSESNDADEVVVIDPIKDVVIKRIPIAPQIHLAHVVLSPDNAHAYVTAQKEGVIYKINAKTFAIEHQVVVDEASEPHGIRLAPDGTTAYVAMLQGKALGFIDLKTDAYSQISLDGSAVQTGVTPDGRFVLVSLYDTKQLAIYEVVSKQITYVVLPQDARGPIQMYSSPDSRFAYLADQGYYFGQPISDTVYKIDLSSRNIVKEIKAGQAPHGAVVSADGRFVYVTNLMSQDVSVIDTIGDQEIKRVKVGSEPNGISIWYRK